MEEALNPISAEYTAVPESNINIFMWNSYLGLVYPPKSILSGQVGSWFV